jgi:hypothetical protein
VIKFVLFLILAIFLAWCGTTVKLGDHTFAGHVKRIWQSEETKDLRKGIKDKATDGTSQDVVDEMKEGAKPVVEEARRKIKGESSDTDDSTKDSSESPAPVKQ